MFFSFYALAVHKAPVLTDIIFWIIVASMILVRFIDIKIFKGLTAENEPAMMSHWVKYSIKLIPTAVFLYMAGKIIAHFKIF